MCLQSLYWKVKNNPNGGARTLSDDVITQLRQNIPSHTNSKTGLVAIFGPIDDELLAVVHSEIYGEVVKQAVLR